jgi:hypothetical protein
MIIKSFFKNLLIINAYYLTILTIKRTVADKMWCKEKCNQILFATYYSIRAEQKGSVRKTKEDIS